MPIVSVQEIVQILQISIAPVVLISGVGLSGPFTDQPPREGDRPGAFVDP